MIRKAGISLSDGPQSWTTALTLGVVVHARPVAADVKVFIKKTASFEPKLRHIEAAIIAEEKLATRLQDTR